MGWKVLNWRGSSTGRPSFGVYLISPWRCTTKVCFNSNPDGCDGGMIDTPWSYIKSTGAVSGGQYQGTGPFGKGLCSDFSLPHCHHHGPQGKDPYPAEGKPGCPSESSPAGPTKCDSTAKAPHDDFKKDKYSYNGKTQTASGEKAIQQMIMAGGPVVSHDCWLHPPLP